jgi:hypothetical protein
MAAKLTNNIIEMFGYSVICKSQQWDGPDPLGSVAPWGDKPTLYWLTLKTRPTRPFETTGTVPETTKRHIPQTGNLQCNVGFILFFGYKESSLSLRLRFEIQPTCINYIFGLIAHESDLGITSWITEINVGTVCNISAFLIVHRYV